jgi:hypothetical protein
MSASLRELRRLAEDVAVPRVDVPALVAAGERKLRRRRAGTVASAATLVLALVVGGTALTDRGDRSRDPVKDPTTSTPSPTEMESNPESVRPLTYAVGSTIRYGRRSIDAGEYVHYVNVTDDGVVFVRGNARWQQPDRAALWFTDGSTVERIGTVSGSAYLAFPVASSAAGSTLVWSEPNGDRGRDFVVYDTERMRVLGRFPEGAPVNYVLSVHDDVVYFGLRHLPCKEVVSFHACVRDGSVVLRYDVAKGTSTRVSGASYDRDRRSRPRTIVGPLFGESDTVIHDDLVFIRHGRALLADGREPGAEYQVALAQTGAPLRLRVPAGATEAGRLAVSQWLDDGRLVLFAYAEEHGTELPDAGDFLTCEVSTGRCRLTMKGEPGAVYQVPNLD